jgi:hypothetical protein
MLEHGISRNVDIINENEIVRSIHYLLLDLVYKLGHDGRINNSLFRPPFISELKEGLIYSSTWT